VEVQFDRICRDNGIEHLLTRPATPTTTGKIERFHRTLRLEFDTRQVFRTLKLAQSALDEWVAYYNTTRPHQSLGDAIPANRFQRDAEPNREPRPTQVALAVCLVAVGIEGALNAASTTSALTTVMVAERSSEGSP
jgi:hypothetical protein